jgi:hypothetical protein
MPSRYQRHTIVSHQILLLPPVVTLEHEEAELEVAPFLHPRPMQLTKCTRGMITVLVTDLQFGVQVMASILGTRTAPWEQESMRSALHKACGVLRGLLLLMLSRDAASRPTMATVNTTCSAVLSASSEAPFKSPVATAHGKFSNTT